MSAGGGPMNRRTGETLLRPGDPPPAIIDNPRGRSPFLLIGDHAGNVIPEALGGLGLPEHERERHIGWDIGVRALGAALAARLDAVFIHQRYSRLVVDCNRDPDNAEAAPEVSDGTAIPGNAGLDAAERAARVREIHTPYHAAIAGEIARRGARGEGFALVSLHSFTPVMGGQGRPWEIGVLHDRGDTSLALYLLEGLRQIAGITVGDNEPYRMDTTDYTVPRFAYADAIPYVELELRQDLIEPEAGAARWAETLAGLLGAWPGIHRP